MRICVDCGIDVVTGRSLVTTRAVDIDQLYEATNTIVQLLSWILWFGLYPIAAESYGQKKPYFIWGVSIVTIIISVWYWMAGGLSPTASVPLQSLMLWHPPTADAIEAAYGDMGSLLSYDNLLHGRDVDPDFLNELATKKLVDDHGIVAGAQPKLQKLRDEAQTDADPMLLDYVNKKDELESTVPAENLAQAAYAALPASEQVLPTFHWYQLITNTFLHAGIMHLAGNLVFLLVIGSRVNALLGQLFTGILYFVLGILASGAFYISSMHDFPQGPALGASGAIMGMAGLFLVFFPVGRIYMVFWIRFGFIALFRRYTKIFAPRGFWVLLFFIAFDILATLLGSHDGTAHWAHLGGFISGIVIGLALLLSRQVDAGGGDILSALLGRRAWALIGKPIARMQAAADVPPVPAVRAMDLNFHE